MKNFKEFLNEISQNPDLVSKLKGADNFEELLAVFKSANMDINQEELCSMIKEFYFSKNNNSEPQALDDENLELVAGGRMDFVKIKALALASLLPLVSAANASAEVFKVSDVPAVSKSIIKVEGKEAYKSAMNSAFGQAVSNMGYQDVDIFKGAFLNKGADINGLIRSKNNGTSSYDTILSKALSQFPEVLHWSGVNDESGKELLCKVAIKVKYDVVKFLLDQGADPNFKLDQGSYTTTPFLLFVARHGTNSRIAIPFLDLLLEHGANINEQDSEGRTVLSYSLSPEVVQYLLEHGADMEIKNKKNETPKEKSSSLRNFLSMKKDYSDSIKECAKIVPEDPIKGDVTCALITAVDATINSNYSNNYMVAIKRLLDMGGDATEALKDVCASDDGSAGCYRLANLILKYGADPSEAIVYACGTPYESIKYASYAYKKSHGSWGGENSPSQIVQLLAEHGADVNQEDSQGVPLLIRMAYRSDNFNKAKILIEHGADVNAKCGDKDTVLAIARKYNNDRLEKLLIEKGAQDG